MNCLRFRIPRFLPVSVLLLVSFAINVHSADLTLLSEGKSTYQIVTPDTPPTPELASCLEQTARLLQAAFKANGADVAIISESKRVPSQPALLLGNTAFAKQNSVDVTTLTDWSYIHKAVGKDIIIAGHDHASSVKPDAGNARRREWDRTGTAKAAADFARTYMGVRFLFPDLPGYTQVSAHSKNDLLASPSIEFLSMKAITVPDTLNTHKAPLLRINSSHPAGGSFYDLAHNRFPRVNALYGSHTWDRAVPAEKYMDAHPEYFALINGERMKDKARPQYCLSNPDVQELIYQDLVNQVEAGYDYVDLGQPDGYRECQCEACAKLWDTGGDWSEKIWILNRRTAERLLKSHPKARVTMMSYILTATPPKTFKAFPANTSVMLTGTNEEDIAPWRSYEIPGGFTGYVYNWCPNLGSRYTPMRTPQYVEAQVKRLAAGRIQALYRDGPGQLFGLEGPVYYTMGRMFDDPDHNAAKDLIPEFCDAAFGKASPIMRTFYDQLYDAIMLYSDHLGTRNNLWTYQPLEGRKRKTVRDPFQLLAFLYHPELLASLEANLIQAEKLADNAKIKARLSLVRTEFDYIRHLARVIHLYQAFTVQPDEASRDRLLNAIDARNAFIEALYPKKGEKRAEVRWEQVFFPFPGHDANHLRLAHDGYQEPFANTCLNWDTKAMRRAPLPGKKRISVAATSTPATLDGPEWKHVATQTLTVAPPFNQAPRNTTLQMLHDKTNLYVRMTCELPPDGKTTFSPQRRDLDLSNQESVEVYLSPAAEREISYRFMAGAHAKTGWDAAAGFITDVMDPRHGRDDATWNGEWTHQPEVDVSKKQWRTLITIPFKTLGVAGPTPGTTWRANFARNHQLVRSMMDRAIWSSAIGNTNMNDRSIFGEIVFE
ncbi:uncharacterized protein DUF4838 [Roseimicrobium gellanilyticum]|uniref:Uncharacterized protein DUF4838 n=1 Tax=Roseimicrobium gellanilyticum TaxID=748857 RepID=A0A366HEB1_9BACT|nr:DUF4838 domain-containing protein [Roseimicrobium gellanilyticum]RBP39648.1 uncharacterized protein DUF4838 [Roseimicrobium gellanilyticum]